VRALSRLQRRRDTGGDREGTLREGRSSLCTRIGDMERLPTISRGSPHGRWLSLTQMGEATLEGSCGTFLTAGLTSSCAPRSSAPDWTYRRRTRSSLTGQTSSASPTVPAPGKGGRGSVQAFAYFLIPGEDILTRTRQSGFRPSGDELFGRLQAGHEGPRDTGTGTFSAPNSPVTSTKSGSRCTWNARGAVAELRERSLSRKSSGDTGRVPAFIPEDYIIDPTLRLSFYRRWHP